MPSEKQATLTIAELARHAQVSPATVSKALNGRDDISEQTRQQVLDTADRLNYGRPAKRNRRGRNALQRVGLVSFAIPEESLFGQYPYALLIQAISAEIKQDGGEVVLTSGDDKTIRNDRERMVDGLIVLGPVTQQQMDSLGDLPTVCTPDRVEAEGDFDRVYQDNIGGTAQITKQLIELGHRRIGLVAHTWRRPPFVDRATGYQQAMYEAQLEPSILRFEEHWTTHGKQIAQQVLESDWTAMVTVTDNLAIDIIGYMAEAGVHVPEHMSVVGFDRRPWPKFWGALPLTAVDGCMEEVGRQAVDALRQRVQGGRSSTTHIVVQPQIMKGNSTGPVLQG